MIRFLSHSDLVSRASPFTKKEGSGTASLLELFCAAGTSRALRIFTHPLRIVHVHVHVVHACSACSDKLNMYVCVCAHVHTGLVTLCTCTYVRACGSVQNMDAGLWTLDSGLDSGLVSWTGLWTEIWTGFWTDTQFNDDHFQP